MCFNANKQLVCLVTLMNLSGPANHRPTTPFSLQFRPFPIGAAVRQAINVVQEFNHLLWRQRRPVREVVLDPLNLVLQGEGAG
jgi:hypothetical protein